MCPSSLTLLGSGSGQGVQYKIKATYGKPLILDETPDTGVQFIGWRKGGGFIPKEYNGFNEDDELEALFSKSINITIRHVGTGKGATKVIQDNKIIGQSDGTVLEYQVSAQDILDLTLKETTDKSNKFLGWEDIDGKPLNPDNVEIINGIIIIARFEEITTSITIKHVGDGSSEIIQSGVVLASGNGNNIEYSLTATLADGFNINTSANYGYILESIKDSNGAILSNSISPLDIYENMTIVITFKVNTFSITVNHVGQGSGISTITQDGNVLGTGNGNNISYSINPLQTSGIDIQAIADEHYEVLEIQDGNGNILPNSLTVNQLYDNMIINIVFALESVEAGTGTSSGSNIYHEQEYVLGSKGGLVTIDYNMGSSIPDKMEVWYNGQLVITTESINGNIVAKWEDANGVQHEEAGFVKSTGQLSFNYTPVNFIYTCKVVIKPALSSGTYWWYQLNPPI